MATIKRLEELEAWQEARKLSRGVYIITTSFPMEEKYNTVKHLRESGRGTMANIAEGFGRYHFKESMKFYSIALGCLEEVRSDMYCSFDNGYIQEVLFRRFVDQIEKVKAKINGLLINTRGKIGNV